MGQHADEEKNLYAIGFYNIENLFDTIDDPNTLDDDFTPDTEKNWTEKRYRKKLKKVGRVISNIGYKEIGYAPVLLGLAEVENATVLQDLVNSKFLTKKSYDFVHYDSPDERGIDVALLYRKDRFEVLHSEAHQLHLFNEEGQRDYTRDILHVHGKLEGNEVHILVNHWPSRRKGTELTAYKRMAAAKKNISILEGILNKDPEARLIVMGDFNDDPKSESVRALVATGLYNPMEILLTHAEGTLSYKDVWHLFDQVIISHNFLQGGDNPFQFKEAAIFNPETIQEYKGRYKGLPFRTYAGKKYLGGFSDHFPVYGIFSIK